MIVDQKAERGRWKETLPEISHEINIVLWLLMRKTKAYLTLMWLWKIPRFWITGYWYSDISLRGFPLVMGNASKSLEKTIRAVTNSEVRGLMKVIEELRVENTPLSTSIADHIEVYRLWLCTLLFSNGYVEQSISLEKQLNIIRVADLVLPDKGNFLWGNIYHYGAFIRCYADCH